MKAAKMPSLNEARRLSRTLIFLRRMTVWKKQNCEVFLIRLPVKTGNYLVLSTLNSALRGASWSARALKPQGSVQARAVGITACRADRGWPTKVRLIAGGLVLKRTVANARSNTSSYPCRRLYQ